MEHLPTVQSEFQLYNYAEYYPIANCLYRYPWFATLITAWVIWCRLAKTEKFAFQSCRFLKKIRSNSCWIKLRQLTIANRSTWFRHMLESGNEHHWWCRIEITIALRSKIPSVRIYETFNAYNEWPGYLVLQKKQTSGWYHLCFINLS